MGKGRSRKQARWLLAVSISASALLFAWRYHLPDPPTQVLIPQHFTMRLDGNAYACGLVTQTLVTCTYSAPVRPP